VGENSLSFGDNHHIHHHIFRQADWSPAEETTFFKNLTNPFDSITVQYRYNISQCPAVLGAGVVDPDPDPHFERGFVSGSRRAKMTRKYRKKLRIFML
jgi:hypothetical protein